MPFSKDYRRGRENHDATRNDFDQAVKRWQEAPHEEKPKHAQGILAHAGGMGKKLSELIPDSDVVNAIKEDAKRA